MCQIVFWTGQRRQMPHIIEALIDVEGVGAIKFLKSELGIGPKMLDIQGRARNEVVQAHHLMAVLQQTVTQMGADESRGPRNQVSQTESPLKHLSGNYGHATVLLYHDLFPR